MSCLFILEIKVLLAASFTNTLAHSAVCLYLFMVFFAMEKIVSLIRSHLCYFLLLLPWEIGLKKILV